MLILSAGYVLRLVGGSVAGNIPLTHWIVIMTYLLSLFLALAKRRDDVLIMNRTGTPSRKNTVRYSLEFINQLLTLNTAMTLFCYIMYTVQDEVMSRFGTRHVYVTALFVLAGFMRYLQLSLVDEKSGAPEKLAVHDSVLRLILVASLYCMEAMQILLIFLSAILLGRLVSQNPMCRAAFVFVFCCSYPYLLFSLVMEQYVFAFFYLVIFLYAVCSHGKKDKLLFFGATGTLTTSVIFAPILIENTKFRDWKKWLFDLFCLGIGYVFVMLLFCRGDLILRLVGELRLYKNFTGQSVPFFARCMQYTSFIAGCFTAPLARPTKYIHPSTGEVYKTLSWQLAPVEAWNIAGIVILCLCVAGFIVNQKSLLARISFAWILFSAFILCLLGWGTKENGLVLYSLYFGWAFAVLLFLLATRIAKLTRIAILPAILSLAFGAVLIKANSASI